MASPEELRSLFEQGKNVSAYLRKLEGLTENNSEIIEQSYDLQSGSYSSAMDNQATQQHKKEYTAEIVSVIRSLCHPKSVMEAGVGEASTFSGVIAGLGNEPDYYGFDLCWSRVAYARKWLHSNKQESVRLCTGDLFQIPLADDTVDVVYTSHSIEPNGGKEIPLLEELYRVAKKYLILIEPGYELASSKARKRMEQHGYCRSLVGFSEGLGYEVLDHRLMNSVANPLNPSAIIIIRKKEKKSPSELTWVCPKYRTVLREKDNVLFSEHSPLVYPVIAGVPCLREEHGILAGKFQEIMNL
ncbi:class I SAM-dependent methyltransferase [Endozoicomonas numazuensis]|uniref:Methyltransferase type 11 n=1 Tax=Endozoicomonas numazuensis TaxID=1137799 RepID=A0A081NE44_9GAMM|nr:class I SAM-dependent methyltransferase [Endozoicomonas numazuensis]KEQ16717.1 methyltransferase type 11 [Endozoicomonas numazuensis]